MEKLYQRVKKYSLGMGMVKSGESVVAGVSGGADSLCLFLVLLRMSREMGFYLQVVHVHHGLRESAQGDLYFVKALCEKEKVPCRCVMADAAARAVEWGTGVEEAGRRLRYAAFEETRLSLEAERGKPCRIAVAHHREDQAETVLFHLCRGTDLRGARGMLPVSGHIVRPLLRETRAGIEAFLRGQGLKWREDETNEDTSYTRNYLRGEVLPRLKEGVNPSAAENLARFAGICAETERFLEKVTEEAMERCRLKPLPSEEEVPDKEKGGKDGRNAMERCRLKPLLPEEEVPDKEKGGKDGRNAMERCRLKPLPSEEKVPGEEKSGKGGGNDIVPEASAVLSLGALKKEDPLIRGRILYCCLALSAGGRKDLSAVHVDAMRGLCDGENDGSLSLPGNVTLFRSGGALFFYRKHLSAQKADTVPKDNRDCSPQKADPVRKDDRDCSPQTADTVRKDNRDCSPQKADPVRKDDRDCSLQKADPVRKDDRDCSPQTVAARDSNSLYASPLARELRRLGAVIPLSEEEYECKIFAFDGDLTAIPQNKYTKWLDYDKLKMFPVFRTRQAGDRMTLLAPDREDGLISKKLAKVMIDGKIPAHIRSEAVLPFCGNEALWIPGLRMGDRFRVTAGTTRILEISWRKARQ